MSGISIHHTCQSLTHSCTALDKIVSIFLSSLHSSDPCHNKSESQVGEVVIP